MIASITSSARPSGVGGARPRSSSCAFVARQAALKDLTLDHITNDRLHVFLCKRSQRLRANISKGATAQSKRGHGNVIWCLNNRDHLVLARCPEGIPHSRSGGHNPDPHPVSSFPNTRVVAGFEFLRRERAMRHPS